MGAAMKIDTSRMKIANYETLFRESLIGKTLSLGEITAFKCIRLCFGEMHTIDRKFEKVAGQISNGEFNIIIEQMNWNFIQDDEVLISDQMNVKEIGVLWGFVQTRIVKALSLNEDRLQISLEDDIELVAEKFGEENSDEEKGLCWYFSKGEEWLLTYDEDGEFEYSELKEHQS